MSTTFTARTSITPTVMTGRPSIAQSWGLLLINGVDYLLINATDRLIIAVATTWTVYTGRTLI